MNLENQNLEPSMKTLMYNLGQLLYKNTKDKQQFDSINAKIKQCTILKQMIQLSIDISKRIKAHSQTTNPQDTNNFSTKESSIHDDYQNLQIQLQKSQVRNRELVRNELTLKLYCEQTEQKLADSKKSNQQLFKSTKYMIFGLKRQNERLLQENKRMIKQKHLSTLKTQYKVQNMNKSNELLKSLSKKSNQPGRNDQVIF